MIKARQQRSWSIHLGAYPAMGVPFTLLRFPHRQHNDVAYFEIFIKGEYVEDTDLIEQCAQRFEKLHQRCPKASRSSSSPRRSLNCDERSCSF